MKTSKQLVIPRAVHRTGVHVLERVLPLAALIVSLAASACGQSPGGGNGPGY
jgi:hypothetical protein